MERLPDPPSAAEILLKPPPDRRVLPVGTLLWRVFLEGGPHPVRWNEFRSFGPTASRFDHHPVDPPPRVHPGHGIMYAADLYSAACAEFFQAGGAINRIYNKPWLVQFALAETLTMIDLTGGWMIRAGGNAAIASGDREQARKWSRVFHEAWPDIDGICYRSSLNPQWLAFALYERAARAIPPTPLLHAPLTDSRLAPLIANAVAETGYELV
ncbi:MAG TPA: RES family NAD+ phosphorylase [Thermoanaerobaculia bacterium]